MIAENPDSEEPKATELIEQVERMPNSEAGWQVIAGRVDNLGSGEIVHNIRPMQRFCFDNWRAHIAKPDDQKIKSYLDRLWATFITELNLTENRIRIQKAKEQGLI